MRCSHFITSMLVRFCLHTHLRAYHPHALLTVAGSEYTQNMYTNMYMRMHLHVRLHFCLHSLIFFGSSMQAWASSTAHVAPFGGLEAPGMHMVIICTQVINAAVTSYYVIVDAFAHPLFTMLAAAYTLHTLYINMLAAAYALHLNMLAAAYTLHINMLVAAYTLHINMLAAANTLHISMLAATHALHLYMLVATARGRLHTSY